LITGSGEGFGFLGTNTAEGARLKFLGPKTLRLGLSFGDLYVGTLGRTKVEALGELFMSSRLLGLTLRLI